MKIQRAASYHAEPWKNGGGVTREIVRIARANSDGFIFRLSLATVSQDGPFSLFPGIARVLIVTEGNGMRLQGAFSRDAKLFEAVRFSGEEAIVATLVEGPTKDFNVMWSEEAFPSLSVSILRSEAAVVRGFGAICALRGSASITVGTEDHLLETYDTILLEECDLARVSPTSGSVVTIVSNS